MFGFLGMFWVLSNREFFLLSHIVMPWYKGKDMFRKIGYAVESGSGT